LDPIVCLENGENMLKDRKHVVERMAANIRLQHQMVLEYGEFLRTLFSLRDWFVTLTFRDRHQDSERDTRQSAEEMSDALNLRRKGRESPQAKPTKCPPDPRLESWEPDSRYRREPGPPVRDAALREIEHWLLELGWEAAGHKRQEIFDRLADGLFGSERQRFAKQLCRQCLCCTVYNDPVCTAFYYEIRKVSTGAIGWVIAEEFGRAGGRWHVHLIIRGVQHLRRKRWWKRAFMRFGRARIEPIHE
jgi:hypothetical protein